MRCRMVHSLSDFSSSLLIIKLWLTWQAWLFSGVYSVLDNICSAQIRLRTWKDIYIGGKYFQIVVFLTIYGWTVSSPKNSLYNFIRRLIPFIDRRVHISNNFILINFIPFPNSILSVQKCCRHIFYSDMYNVVRTDGEKTTSIIWIWWTPLLDDLIYLILTNFVLL